jgi:hypothetical protein
MASNTGAYFEGMKYANQGVKPINFGELSMGFAKIVEDKRAQEKEDRIRRENTQMEMQKLFGEEVYSAFDGTGLKDVDVVTGKIKDSIVARANVLNSMFEKGELTAPQMMQEMQKLNAQSKKISSFASSAAKSFEDIQNNPNSSAATDHLIQRANQLFQEATPVMDSSGKISFLSKDGDVMTNNPVDQLDRLLQNRSSYDIDGLAENIVNTQGQIRKTYENGQVITSKGEVGESQIEYISDLVNAMDEEDLYDIAYQLGFTPEMDNNNVFKMVDEEGVKSKVKEELVNYTKQKFKSKEAVDEVAGKKISLELQKEYRAAEKYKQENEGAVVNVVGTEDGKEEIQVYPPAGKTVTVKSLVVGGKSLPAANIGNYVVDKDGKHKASISYQTVIDIPDAGIGEPTQKEVLVTEVMELTDPATINQIRAQFKMEPIKEVSLPIPTKKKAY